MFNGAATGSPVPSDDSASDLKNGIAGPSKPRILRGTRSPPPPQTTPEQSQSETDDAKYTHFRFTQPQFTTEEVRAAWTQAGGDVRKASDLLNDPNWKPPSSSPSSHVAQKSRPQEVGRVKEIDDAKQAERMAIREKGKKSMIYMARPAGEGKPPSKPASVPQKAALPLSAHTPASPVITQPRTKRVKRKIIDSDSEDEFVGGREDASLAKRLKEDSNHETRALKYMNSAAAEALQELTGCTAPQARKIIELRPFSDVDDLRIKLGQGKKKAGPAGISSRMFEDCATIFEGYGRVDSILEDCEQTGAELKAEIASWTEGTRHKSNGRGSVASPRGTPSDDEFAADGALTLRSQALVADRPSYYFTSQPAFVSPEVQLKEYQMVGINWLNLLYNKGLSCILADEMGLGKTCQVISFLAHLKEQGSQGPHLIVVPSSTLENWLREFDRFAPSISVTSYYAGKEERVELRQTLLDTQRSRQEVGWEVLITTYNLAQGDDKDRKFFRRIQWDVSVFDEGHVLKNFQSQRYQTLLRYESKWRLLLTGTPLQNNLQELVVLKDLPKKSERIEWCEMTPLQKTIYNETLQRSRKTIFDAEAEAQTTGETVANGKAPKKGRANGKQKDKVYLENSSNVLMDLRKAASHPMLFRRRFTDDTLASITKLLLKEPDFKRRGALYRFVKEDMEVMTDAELQLFCATKYLQPDDCYLQAGKVKVLLQLLERYHAEGRRVLIFSQFTQILDILQKVLEKEGIRFSLLTGATPVDARQSLVDEFTDDESISVFLLSTKAGGMGINLTAASVVIMFDQDFNPHNDKQAQDRAYRIGQKQNVDVVKLITKGSIEEDMLALGQTKLALDEAVAGEEGDERVEREIKTSLMNVVRKKLEEKPEDAVPAADAGAAIDPGSPLSDLDEN
ncbi:hypothetical protein IEO21_01521 [Rhodonia placenta]|uniref:Uncharacterized protein n=1 Tax=Rhodonia placenta TaxID=104341 RepID=A0A8H7U5T9_9APHY|nr:hypothetical protein IEO21_01521 [Postia placenta]